MCFTANFVKFLRMPFYIEHLWWLLLLWATVWPVSDDIYLFITGQCSLYITPEYIQENKGFMVILGGIERKNGPAMG